MFKDDEILSKISGLCHFDLYEAKGNLRVVLFGQKSIPNPSGEKPNSTESNNG